MVGTAKVNENQPKTRPGVLRKINILIPQILTEERGRL